MKKIIVFSILTLAIAFMVGILGRTLPSHDCIRNGEDLVACLDHNPEGEMVMCTKNFIIDGNYLFDYESQRIFWVHDMYIFDTCDY